MEQERIRKAFERIDAALARIDLASDRIGANPLSNDAIAVAKDSLRGELAGTLRDLDSLIESIEQ